MRKSFVMAAAALLTLSACAEEPDSATMVYSCKGDKGSAELKFWHIRAELVRSGHHRKHYPLWGTNGHKNLLIDNAVDDAKAFCGPHIKETVYPR